MDQLPITILTYPKGQLEIVGISQSTGSNKDGKRMGCKKGCLKMPTPTYLLLSSRK